MRVRLISISILICFLLYLQPYGVNAASVLPSLEMGYSPGSLSPTATGVPVYTAGDSMWVMSDAQYAVTLTLSSPNGTVAARATIGPQSPALLHLFSLGDAPGTWSVGISVPGGTKPVESLSLLVVANNVTSPDMTAYSLSSVGELSMNFTLTSSNAYDMFACAVGSPLPDTVSIALPSSIGTGNMLISLNGSVVQMTPEVQSVPFDFWVELHQNYSYSDEIASTVVSRDVEVGSTISVPISGSNATSSPFTTTVNLRPGRFTLRAFFDSSKGLSVVQVPVLILQKSSGWISLDGCSSSVSLASSAFTLSSVLGTSTQIWPREVYLMYLEDGVEMYSVTQLQVRPSALVVVAAPWDTALTDSELTLQAGLGVQESASSDGLIFLTADQYPISVGVTLLEGQNQSVEIPSAFSYVTLPINSSKLVVDTTIGGKAIPGAVIVISSGNSTVYRTAAGPDGMGVFYLPQGNYDISATFDNETRTASFLTRLGNDSVITLDLPGPANSSPMYSYVLLITAGIGLIASAVVWVKVYQGRAARFKV